MEMASKATLQEHQAALYELLQVLDEICRKHQIRYMLFAGTALGAVRHRGFVPWDDDLDVVMLRPEYERFLAVAEQELDREEFFLQKEFSEHWPMFFSKLRKNNTTCLERYIPKDPLMHQGIYIDIFPCDNLAEGKMFPKLQFLASKVVIAKSLDRRGYLTDSVMKKGFMIVCRNLPVNFLKQMAQQPERTDSEYVHTFFGGAARYEKNVFPRRWLEETVELPFEGGSFPVSAFYDELLTGIYGDYMTPPPEQARSMKVHAEFVDLERPYTEYLEKQKTMKFREYSKSIR